MKELKEANVRVIFEQENLDTAETDSTLMISIVESFAQAENESRSQNIRWGIKDKMFGLAFTDFTKTVEFKEII